MRATAKVIEEFPIGKNGLEKIRVFDGEKFHDAKCPVNDCTEHNLPYVITFVSDNRFFIKSMDLAMKLEKISQSFDVKTGDHNGRLMLSVRFIKDNSCFQEFAIREMLNCAQTAFGFNRKVNNGVMSTVYPHLDNELSPDVSFAPTAKKAVKRQKFTRTPKNDNGNYPSLANPEPVSIWL